MLHKEVITPVTQEVIVADDILVTQTPRIFNFDAQTETLAKIKKNYTPKNTIKYYDPKK